MNAMHPRRHLQADGSGDAVESTLADLQADAADLLQQVESVLQATDDVPQQEELETLREALTALTDGEDASTLAAHDDVLPRGFQ